MVSASETIHEASESSVSSGVLSTGVVTVVSALVSDACVLSFPPQAVSVIDVTARSVKIIAIFLFIVIFLSKSNFAVLHFSAAR